MSGDIVYVLGEDENGIIEWDNKALKFAIDFDGWCSDFDYFHGKDLEVIRQHIRQQKFIREGVKDERS